ncbi:MAG: hypothetical protein WBW55_08750 [Desulfobaccales bacterium]
MASIKKKNDTDDKDDVKKDGGLMFFEDAVKRLLQTPPIKQSELKIKKKTKHHA